MTIIDALSKIKDPRSPLGLRHPLPVVLLITLMATMSGDESIRALGRFAANNKDALCELLGITRVPSDTTIATTLESIGYKELTDEFNLWAGQYIEVGGKEGVAFDGKAMASTVTNCNNEKQDFVSHVSAFVHKRGVVIGCLGMQNKKTSEIPTVKDLIKLLDLEGVVFTFDALHCQKKTASEIIESNNDYVMQVKLNQPKLYKSAENISQTQIPISEHETFDKGHGRREYRKYTIFEADPILTLEWKGLSKFIKVERDRLIINSGEIESEISFYISSYDCNDAIIFGELIRGHWSIENSLHYVKDVVLNEDNNGISTRNKAENLSLIKNFAINTFRKNGHESIKYAMEKFRNKINDIFKLLRT